MQLTQSFPGTERYTVERQIGAGGFGIVYLARDQVRGDQVALKVLRNFDAARLYAFKREFRALADVAHPNLVSLYELTSEGPDWFFTMELIEGQSFLDYVCTSWRNQRANPDADTVEINRNRRPQPRSLGYDEDRLRASLDRKSVV